MLEAVNTFSKGMQTDVSPMLQGNESLSNCLNGTLVTLNGNELILQNDMGNARVDLAFLPPGYEPVGVKEYGGIIYIASYNPITNRSQIGSFPSPLRVIDNDDLEGNKNQESLKLLNFGYSVEEGIKWLNNDIKIFKITNDILHAGDKFKVGLDDTSYLIISELDGLFTVDLGIMNSNNEFIKIDLSCISLEDEDFPTAVDDSKLIEKRNSIKNLDTYSSKIASSLYLRNTLNHPTNFKYGLNVISDGNNYTLILKGELEYSENISLSDDEKNYIFEGIHLYISGQISTTLPSSNPSLAPINYLNCTQQNTVLEICDGIAHIEEGVSSELVTINDRIGGNSLIWKLIKDNTVVLSSLVTEDNKIIFTKKYSIDNTWNDLNYCLAVLANPYNFYGYLNKTLDIDLTSLANIYLKDLSVKGKFNLNELISNYIEINSWKTNINDSDLTINYGFNTFGIEDFTTQYGTPILIFDFYEYTDKSEIKKTEIKDVYVNNVLENNNTLNITLGNDIKNGDIYITNIYIGTNDNNTIKKIKSIGEEVVICSKIANDKELHNDNELLEINIDTSLDSNDINYDSYDYEYKNYYLFVSEDQSFIQRNSMISPSCNITIKPTVNNQPLTKSLLESRVQFKYNLTEYNYLPNCVKNLIENKVKIDVPGENEEIQINEKFFGSFNNNSGTFLNKVKVYELFDIKDILINCSGEKIEYQNGLLYSNLYFGPIVKNDKIYVYQGQPQPLDLSNANDSSELTSELLFSGLTDLNLSTESHKYRPFLAIFCRRTDFDKTNNYEKERHRNGGLELTGDYLLSEKTGNCHRVFVNLYTENENENENYYTTKQILLKSKYTSGSKKYGNKEYENEINLPEKISTSGTQVTLILEELKLNNNYYINTNPEKSKNVSYHTSNIGDSFTIDSSIKVDVNLNENDSIININDKHSIKIKLNSNISINKTIELTSLITPALPSEDKGFMLSGTNNEYNLDLDKIYNTSLEENPYYIIKNINGNNKLVIKDNNNIKQYKDILGDKKIEQLPDRNAYSSKGFNYDLFNVLDFN